MRTLSLSLLATLALACNPEPEVLGDPIEDPVAPPDRTFDMPADAAVCGDGVWCFDVEAPVDPAAPEGEALTIHAAVIPSLAEEPEGVLTINFGGFGAPGTPMLGPWAQAYPELRERYHLVSWDPRGAGASEPLRCATEQFDVLVNTGPIVDLEGAEAHIAARARVIGDCRAEHGAMIDHMGFRAHASDLDAVRAAVGVEEMDYLGYSAGTALGQAYAQFHGQAIRRMALDSAVTAHGGARTLMAYQVPAGLEALDDFQAWCDAEACGIEDVEAAIDEVAALVQDGRVREGTLGRRLIWADLGYGLVVVLYSPLNYPLFAQALQEAREGDGHLLAMLGRAYLGTTPDQQVDPHNTVYQLTNCAGELTPTTAADVLAFEQQYQGITPLAPIYTVDHAWCAAIGAPADPIDEPLTGESVDETILVLQSRLDVATPLEAGQEVADTLADARLVVFEGSGHIASGQSVCMRQHLVDYLVDGVVPEAGTVCED